MEQFKRGGIQKEYEKTSTTFTKRGLWPERYRNEITGLSIAPQHGIVVPTVISHSLDESGGTVTMKRIHQPRVDQILWGNSQHKLFKEIGAILVSIHQLPVQTEGVSLVLLKRRFQDLQSDVLRLSTLRFNVFNMVTQTMQAISQKILNRSKGEFIHGDFTLQNMFGGNGIIIYDWEHSGTGSSLYDIGVFLSFMILLVTDGGWSFKDYYAAANCFLDGYSGLWPLNEEDLCMIDGLRFLGHRQIAQYYLFVLEYLAVVEQVDVAQEILNSGSVLKPEILYNQICDFKVCFDKTWFYKTISAIRRGGYQASDIFWRWFKNEVSKQGN